MDKFASLHAFTKVVEEGGFAAAARVLRLSRSQVNKLVINLEEHLGVQLLHRTTRSVAPTPSGLSFYERARTILSDLAEAEDAIQEQQDAPQGDIKINAPMSFGTMHLASAVGDFMQRYPKIRIQLILNDLVIDPVAEGFDITVRIAELSEMASLICKRIVEAKRVICAAPVFLREHGVPSCVRDLANAPCLHYGNLPTGNHWRLVGPDGGEDVRVNGVLCSNNAEVLRDAAVRGLGIALLPTFIAGAELQAGRLVTILETYQAPSIYLSLLFPVNRYLSARVRLFSEFVVERFGGLPYWDLVQ